MARGIKQLKNLQIVENISSQTFLVDVLETISVKMGGTKLEMQEGINSIPRDPMGKPMASEISCKIEASILIADTLKDSYDMDIVVTYLDGQSYSMRSAVFTGDKEWTGSERSFQFDAMSAYPITPLDSNP